MLEKYGKTAQQATRKKWSHVDYLANLIAGEATSRWDRSIQRRITMACFPVIKTLEQFSWNWLKNH